MIENLDFLAYIDPGTGSLILQVILGALLTGGIFFRRIFFWPFDYINKRRSTKRDAVPED